MRVESQAIREIDYRAREQELRVRFKSGEWYAYEQAPPEVFRAFVEADSKGRFFHEAIDGRYRYRKISG